MIALFDRAAARDFVDVFMLSSSFGKDELLSLAAEVDAGFDPQVLADMIDMLSRYTDRDHPSAASTRRQFAASSPTGPMRSEPARRRSDGLQRHCCVDLSGGRV